jgi:Ca2+:H+ antiporter
MTQAAPPPSNNRSDDEASGGAAADSGGPTAGSSLWREPLYWLLLALPAAVYLKVTHGDPVWLFVASCVAIIPPAGLMGRATENLAETLGAGIGGLLNATFGNAAELIIALMMLYNADRSDPTRMHDLVKASITGSIIGNILLVLGLSIVVGGFFHKKQVFNRTAAGMGSTLLALATIGLLVPTFHYYVAGTGREEVGTLSEEIAVVLAVVYVLSLIFSLKTHHHLFAGPEQELPTTGEHRAPEWGRLKSIVVLTSATAGTAVTAEFLVGTVEHAAHAWGLSNVFVGVIVVAVIGNAAEHSTAVLAAARNKMDLAVNIAVGSSLQIALFVAPVLVFASVLMGHGRPMDLHFTPMETIAVIASILVLEMVCNDGETHWMEGVMLLAVYAVLGLAFYHLHGH